MELCIRTDYCGNDVERVIEYAAKLGVKNIWAFPRIAEHCDEHTGLMDGARLATYLESFERRGLAVRLLTEIVESKDLVSQDAAGRAADVICQTIECMGEVGIGVLFLFIGAGQPASEDETERQWQRLGKLMEAIVPCAERAKVRIATHGHQVKPFLVRGYADLMRVLSLVDSPNSGVTFCPGCHQLLGDDVRDGIRGFGSKIFFVHARDVVPKGNDEFDEVLLGQGEVDPFQVIEELKAIGYRGLICPEHLPRIDYHPCEEIEFAWALGYLECLLRASGAH